MKTNADDSEIRQVGDFFHSYAVDFDSIYGGRRNPVSRLIDRLFRKSMRLRFQRTLSDLSDPILQSILDVGCGSGRYAVELLKMDKEVTGIDLAPGMLAIAERACKGLFPADRYRFILGSYPDTVLGRRFDAALLIGFFDYVQDADAVIQGLKRDVERLFVASFPKASGVLALQRKIRYRLRNCPLYFYTEADIHELMDRTGVVNYRITDLGRDLYLRAELVSA
ncbi:MAG TPA: methyltransferase domain-containing protein [Anaerolineae bacterium]|nr:methyltransferase domain-containing protein [Anaerolineae bacterium]